MNTAAAAGTCVTYGGKGRVGQIVFDSANTWNGLSAYSVGTHEIGHVIGIRDTQWATFNLVSNGRYTGANGNVELSSIGSHASQAWIEDQYGVGSAGSHWKESVYDGELMTSVMNAGYVNPLSRLTLGSLRDFGYAVDMTQADKYLCTNCVNKNLLQIKHKMRTHDNSQIIYLKGDIDNTIVPEEASDDSISNKEGRDDEAEDEKKHKHDHKHKHKHHKKKKGPKSDSSPPIAAGSQ